MPQLIEDYALIGNNLTAALIGRNGSIDWLGFPRFDSGACFSGLLGSDKDGHWSIAPLHSNAESKRSYRDGSLVLETEFHSQDGVVLVTDCMDRRGEHQDVIRIVKGVKGKVAMRMELVIRFEYATVVPWVTRMDDGRLRAVAGADQIIIASPVEMHGEDFKTLASFDVTEGQVLPFSITWAPSYSPIPAPFDAVAACEKVFQSWQKWSSRHKPGGPYADVIKTISYHSEGVDTHPDWWNRCRRDYFAA